MGGSKKLDRLKSCCNHSLRDLCVHKDGAWLKLKKYCHQKDVGYYPDGCIICSKSFSVGCVLPVKMGNNSMVCLIYYEWFSSYIFAVLITP